VAIEVSWFAALCDDDYEFLGVPDDRLLSSWEHCRGIALAAEEAGYDNLLLPSGYAMGIDSVAFAAGIAPLLKRMQLLVAVRMGEMWPPQLARQLATIDQMLGGRLTINIISSALPGRPLESAARYRRTLEIMRVLRDLLDGQGVDVHGEFVDLTIDPPRLRPTGGCPPFYFGGLSEAAREVAAQAADVYLMWPDTVAGVAAVLADMRARASRHGRELRFGYRAHVIVRETEAAARAAARRLMSRLDDATGEQIRRRSLDTTSAGTMRQNELRDSADDEGFAEPGLWTGIGRARSGRARPLSATPARYWPNCATTPPWAWSRSSCPATRTRPKVTCSPGTSCPTWITVHCCPGSRDSAELEIAEVDRAAPAAEERRANGQPDDVVARGLADRRADGAPAAPGGGKASECQAPPS
jgi:alkanesulfonate monooxygenase